MAIHWGRTTMNTTIKMLLVSASVMTMGALTACQSTNNMSERDARYAQKADQKHARFTPEQREQMKAMHAERAELGKKIQQACDKQAVGSSVQIQAGEKTIQGTCDIRFYPEHTAKGKAKSVKEHRGDERRMNQPRQVDGRYAAGQRGEALTDAKRAELVKAYDKRLTEKQALQTAIAQACKGQTHGKAVQLKVGEQQINGQCLVKFKPTQTAKTTTQPTA